MRLGVTATAVTWDCSACGWSGAYEALAPDPDGGYPHCPKCARNDALGTDGGKRPAKDNEFGVDLSRCLDPSSFGIAGDVFRRAVDDANERVARFLAAPTMSGTWSNLYAGESLTMEKLKAALRAIDNVSAPARKAAEAVREVSAALSPPLSADEMVAACDASRAAFLVGPRDAVVAPKRKAHDPDARAKRLRSEYGGRWVR